MLSENTRQDRKTEGTFIAQTVSKFVLFDKMRMDGGCRVGWSPDCSRAGRTFFPEPHWGRPLDFTRPTQLHWLTSMSKGSWLI